MSDPITTEAQPKTAVQEASSARLLIVEDDSSLTAGLTRALTLDGHEVACVANGELALERLQATAFDLMVLDVGLPGIDGFEVLRRLRAIGQRIPVLILTARDAIGDRVHGLDLGADDYMVKPFAIPELSARVRALIRRGLVDHSTRAVHGPLEFDTVARRAFLNDEPLELAAREWAVLQILLEHVEKVVSKDTFIESLTHWTEDLSANAIEVYISRLRAKLEPAGIRIRTVRGFGYMLEEYRPAAAAPTSVVR